jgi:hypothetical protein
MLDFLSKILNVLTHLPDAVLWGVETAINALLDGAAVVITAALGLLPHMPDLPSVGDPQWLHWLNWVYPVGALLGVIVGCVTMYVTFLAVRYVLKLLRAA